jgi:hypothetical protein
VQRRTTLLTEVPFARPMFEPLMVGGVDPRESWRSLTVPTQSDLKAKTQKPLPTDENELEGQQDMGGKQGGQAGFPKPTKRPDSTTRDEDVVPKPGERAPRR